MRGKLLITLLVIPLCFLLLITAQMQADRAREADLEGELLYLPSAKLLQHCTAGMNSVVADLLWLRCIQYIAEENHGEAEFTWLNTMLNTIVDLDPYFVDAYHFGGIFLSALRADDDAAIVLLERGMQHNPRAWELPNEAAMIHWINNQGNEEAEKKAAFYFSLAVATGNAPERTQEMATLLQQRHNLTDIERTMWTEMLESDDTMMRNLAQKKLLEVDIRETCVELNKRLESATAQGQPQPTLATLGLQKTEDIFGGRFFIDAEGVVQNSTLLDNDVKRWSRKLKDALVRYQEQEGKQARRLEQLLDSGVMFKLPDYPYAGKSWSYDPTTGTVE